MYWLPILILVLIGIVAVAWSGIFALILFAIGFVGFIAYVAMRPRADEKMAPPERPGAQPHNEDDTPTGLWGERRPS